VFEGDRRHERRNKEERDRKRWLERDGDAVEASLNADCDAELVFEV